MARHRSKPVETTYVEALHNADEKKFFVQHVTRDGKAIKGKPIEEISEEEFIKRYEPVVRKPRGASNGQGASVPTASKAGK